MRYILITYLFKATGQIDEQVEISKTIKDRDHQTCNVIMDFEEKKVVKCVIQGKKLDTDWERLRNYFYQIYPDAIDRIEKQFSDNDE